MKQEDTLNSTSDFYEINYIPCDMVLVYDDIFL